MCPPSRPRSSRRHEARSLSRVRVTCGGARACTCRHRNGQDGRVLAVEALEALGSHGRAELLRLRPDLAEPRSMSLKELARRAVEPASLSLALRMFDTPTLQVTEVLAALAGRADREQLERLLGVRPGSGGAA